MGEGSFEYVSEYCALFSGQLKTRGQPHEPYPIPLLAPYRVIKKGIDALRARQKPCDTVGERYGSNVAKELQRLFPRVPHVHALRSMYVRCVFEMFQCECALPALTKAALGHQDLHESLFYSATHITDFEKHAGTGPRLCIVIVRWWRNDNQ